MTTCMFLSLSVMLKWLCMCNFSEGTEFSPDFDTKFEAHAGYMFDWTREKDPQMKQKKMKEAVSTLRDLLKHRYMVRLYRCYMYI